MKNRGSLAIPVTLASGVLGAAIMLAANSAPTFAQSMPSGTVTKIETGWNQEGLAIWLSGAGAALGGCPSADNEYFLSNANHSSGRNTFAQAVSVLLAAKLSGRSVTVVAYSPQQCGPGGRNLIQAVALE